MTESAFATALYEHLPERHRAAAAEAAAAAGGQLNSFSVPIARTAERRLAVDFLLLQQQKQVLQRAALLQQCSFFELLAQQKLLDGLHAALRHCVVTLEAFYSGGHSAAAAPAPPLQQQEQQQQAPVAESELPGADAAAGRQLQQQGRPQQPAAAGGDPQFWSLKGSFISAWVWRQLIRGVAAVKAAAAEPGSLRLLLNADAAAALRWINQHFDLLYLLLLAAIETHSFATTGASVSEGFYCMRREHRRLFLLHRQLNYPHLRSSSSNSGNGSQEEQRQSNSGQNAPRLQLPVELLQQHQRISAEAAALAAGLPSRLSRFQVGCCVVFQVLLPHLRRRLHLAHMEQQQASAANAAGTPGAAARIAAAREALTAAVAALQKHRKALQPPPLSLDFLLPSSSSSSSTNAGHRASLQLAAAAATWGDRLQGWLRSSRLQLLVLLLRLRVRQLLLALWLRRSVWDRLVRAFPRLSFCHDFVSFIYVVLYLADPAAFPYWSPYMHLLGLVYVRAQPEALGDAAAAANSTSRRSWWFNLAEGGAQKMRSCLMGVLLLLRALEWWFEYEAALLPLSLNKGDVKAPPPPPRPADAALAHPVPQVFVQFF